MNTREILILKTLQMKQLNDHGGNGDMVEHLLAANPDEADKITKNVCAQIPIELARDMEGLGVLLDLNKREIITLAIRDFLDKAAATLREFDAMPEGEQ